MYSLGGRPTPPPPIKRPESKGFKTSSLKKIELQLFLFSTKIKLFLIFQGLFNNVVFRTLV